MDTQVSVSLVQFIKDTGLIGILMGILFGSYKGVWVWGSLYREMKEDRDRWKSQALKNTNLADRALDLAVPK